MNGRFDHALANLRLPTWERAEFRGENPPPRVKQFTDLFLLDFGSVINRYERERATMLLLGVHAAIRRFRWNHDRLPESLEELKLERRLRTDPFTGKPLIYQRDGETYTLYSAGPLEPASQDKPSADQRVPVHLPRQSRT